MQRAKDPVMEEFWTKAKAHVQTNGGKWQTVKRDTDQQKEWIRYFRGFLDRTPHFLTMLADGRIETAMLPALRPEWFDPVYATADAYEIDRRLERALRPKVWLPPIPREGTQSYPQMLAKHGRPIGSFEEGTKWAHLAGRREGTAPIWKAPGNDTLRSYYKPAVPEAAE